MEYGRQGAFDIIRAFLDRRDLQRFSSSYECYDPGRIVLFNSSAPINAVLTQYSHSIDFSLSPLKVA
jgi:hypothetical protein